MNFFDVIRQIGWHPGVGDPTPAGWLSAAALLAAAVLCGLCARHADKIFSEHPEQHRLMWGMLAAALLFLSVNKQLDLQTWFTAVGRQVAYRWGWYEARQAVQVVFIVTFALLSVALVAALAWRTRRTWRQYWLLWLGMAFLARFILVRAAAFWDVPLPALARYTGGLRINILLETGGAGLIAVAAWRNLRSGTNKASSPAGKTTDGGFHVDSGD